MMIVRILIYGVMILVLHGCGGRSTLMPNNAEGVPLADVCARYHVTWQWDEVTQIVMMNYKGSVSSALVGSATVLLGKQQIVLSAPLRRERSVIYVPEDFEAKVLAPFGVPVYGLNPVVGSSRVHTIVIDAGHGGKDRGTIAPFGMDEKEIVLDVAKRLNSLLTGAGIKVIMTREVDNFIPLPERTMIAASSRADLFVSVHVNSNPDHAVSGLLVYYLDTIAKRDVNEAARKVNERLLWRSLKAENSIKLQMIVTDMMNNLKTAQSQRLAKLIVKEARNESGVKVRGDGIRICRFFVVRNSLVPAVLVETGFLSNRQEHGKLTASGYRQKIAEVVARGILDYANE